MITAIDRTQKYSNMLYLADSFIQLLKFNFQIKLQIARADYSLIVLAAQSALVFQYGSGTLKPHKGISKSLGT